MSELTLMSGGDPSCSNDERHDAALTVAARYLGDPCTVGTLLQMLGLARRSPAGLVAEGQDEYEMPWFTPTLERQATLFQQSSK